MGKHLIDASRLAKFKELQDAQNQALLNEKQNNLTFDTVPTRNSANPVTSDGLYTAITNSQISVYQGSRKVNTIEANGLDYTIKQGNTSIATINIARDMVIDAGEVVDADGTEKKGTDDSAETANLTAGNKYIKLHINNGDPLNNLLWINVNELFRDYTGNDGSKITVTTTNNIIKAVIKKGTIEKTDLVASLQTEISNATSNLAVVQGDDSVEGSIKQQVKALSDEVSDKLVVSSDIATNAQIDALFK